MANIKKLKHLRRMIKNIPKKNINWANYVTEWDEEDWTKCVLCPAAWVASDPFLNNKNRLVLTKDDLNATEGYNGNSGYGGESLVLRQMFGLSEEETDDLFYPSDLPFDSDPLTHKALFLATLNDMINYL